MVKIIIAWSILQGY